MRLDESDWSSGCYKLQSLKPWSDCLFRLIGLRNHAIQASLHLARQRIDGLLKLRAQVRAPSAFVGAVLSFRMDVKSSVRLAIDQAEFAIVRSV